MTAANYTTKGGHMKTETILMNANVIFPDDFEGLHIIAKTEGKLIVQGETVGEQTVEIINIVLPAGKLPKGARLKLQLVEIGDEG